MAESSISSLRSISPLRSSDTTADGGEPSHSSHADPIRLTDLGESSKSRKTSLTRSSSPELEEETGLWVFGYGSLCWHQGFDYEKSMTGFVEGFSRKFWQGNTTHRGTVKKPGRVATLVEDHRGIVWGKAFQVKGDEALPYLNNRECELGGYLTTITTFYPRQTSNNSSHTRPFPVVLYLATPSNSLWLGESPLPDIAKQIVECTGGSGHNVEYLLRLADFVRDNFPEAADDHLFTLEFLVRTLIEERKLCLRTLMGEKKAAKVEPVPEAAEPPAEAEVRSDSFQFTSTVPTKKLRCVNIC